MLNGRRINRKYTFYVTNTQVMFIMERIYAVYTDRKYIKHNQN